MSGVSGPIKRLNEQSAHALIFIFLREFDINFPSSLRVEVGPPDVDEVKFHPYFLISLTKPYTLGDSCSEQHFLSFERWRCRVEIRVYAGIKLLTDVPGSVIWTIFVSFVDVNPSPLDEASQSRFLRLTH